MMTIDKRRTSAHHSTPQANTCGEKSPRCVRVRACTAAVSATLALASLLLLSTPSPADGFFRPTTRVKGPPQGPKPVSSLPTSRHGVTSPSSIVTTVRQQLQYGEGGGSSRGRLQRLLMSGATDEGAESSSGEQLGGEGEDSVAALEEDEDGRLKMPPIEVPEMMDNEERTRLWMAVFRAEAEAVKCGNQGKTEEAEKHREHANKLRYEDPFTALQDELDEAVKNEEFVRIARLRLQMNRIGVPPNAEMQARAEGKDPSSVMEETAKHMLGMASRREGSSKSGGQGDGTGSSGGYSSKSVTMTHGVRVEVRSQYYPEQSNPLKDQYIFVYKVKITNQSPQTVQLVSRTWEIKAIEATEAPQLVKGPGVVGQQPVLEPGQSFEYSSACPITCAPKEGYQVLGRMKGSYLIVMGSVGEAAFEAKIDPFYLILPQAVLDERSGGSGGGGPPDGGGIAGNDW